MRRLLLPHLAPLLKPLIGLAAACVLAPAVWAQAAGFDFDEVAREAQALAAQPWRKPPAADAQRAALDYDAYRRIQFNARNALWRGRGSPFEMLFFPLGGSHNTPVRLFEVVGGKARPVVVPGNAFDYDGVLSPEAIARSSGVAGWRLTYPLNEPAKRDEVISFLGSSYFRALGAGQRYGLSARALAVDTVGGQGEEFPAFTAFWFEPPAPNAKELVFYGLLDGPRVAGAYRFVLKPGATTVVEVRSRLYLRGPVAMLGIAPLSSMYLHGENQPSRAPVTDFRPEVHDSDGLQIEAADGEWIWRPLSNPKRPFISSFALKSPRGFGLMQRDRAFASYEDVEARYELRPSAWVEPIGDWGPGRVELLQFNTPDETHDNVAAYWVPEKLPAPGTPLDLSWRVHWQGDAARVPPGARVLQTRVGVGYTKQALGRERHTVSLDFVGNNLPADDGKGNDAVQAVASANANVRVVRVHAYPNPARQGWRATVEFDQIDPKQAVELRVFLRNGTSTVSETWSYAVAPDEPAPLTRVPAAP